MKRHLAALVPGDIIVTDSHEVNYIFFGSYDFDVKAKLVDLDTNSISYTEIRPVKNLILLAPVGETVEKLLNFEKPTLWRLLENRLEQRVFDVMGISDIPMEGILEEGMLDWVSKSYPVQNEMRRFLNENKANLTTFGRFGTGVESIEYKRSESQSTLLQNT